jgi:NAD-dependent dihydropyrimidine dehydrogenase PreA subunit
MAVCFVMSQRKMVRPIIFVNKGLCEGDGACVDVCPMNVFEIEYTDSLYHDKYAVPKRSDDCFMCMACLAVCPTQAITIEKKAIVNHDRMTRESPK